MHTWERGTLPPRILRRQPPFFLQKTMNTGNNFQRFICPSPNTVSLFVQKRVHSPSGTLAPGTPGSAIDIATEFFFRYS